MTASRDIRIIPVVLAALAGLMVLKIAALIIDERPRSMLSTQTRADITRDMADVTGSIGNRKREETPESAAPHADKQASRATDSAKRAVLESLQERRRELDARSREIDIRDNLLTAAEERLKAQLANIEAREKALSALQEKKQEQDALRIKSLVAIYEGMKPKEAAKIFSRMEMPVLLEVASRLSSRKMSEILGLMQMEVAERLTAELARQAGLEKAVLLSDLPKIEGVRIETRP